MKKKRQIATHLVVCIDNDDYPASLEKRKIYSALSDRAALMQDMIRIVDESGEDYLYPKDCFFAIHLPKKEEKVIVLA